MKSFPIGKRVFDFSDTPYFLGILNLTPDSFSDGARYLKPERALEHALALQAQGVDLLDIGAESTRPGADEISIEEELSRLIPLFELLQGKINIPISLDTRKVKVIERLIPYGIDLINDVSAFEHDPEMLDFLAQTKLPAILMHQRGKPKNMSLLNQYTNISEDVRKYFEEKLNFLAKNGMETGRFILDVGIGFAKVGLQNMQILSSLSGLHSLGLPLLVGLSRKSFLKKYFKEEHEAAERGTLSEVAQALCMQQKVQFLRVHDVQSAQRTKSLMRDYLYEQSKNGASGGRF